jgi:excisionase family DNA binding protein
MTQEPTISLRERLGAVFSPDVLNALEDLVAERVAAEVAKGVPNRDVSPWFSIPAAAAYVGLSERTLEREIKGGRLRSSTAGRRRLIHRDALDAYVKGDGGGEAPATPPRRLEGV